MNHTLISDLHSVSDLPITPDKNGVLIIAGDIEEGHKKNKYRDIISKFCAEFKHVLMVSGNHEYYKKSIHGVDKFLSSLEDEFKNLSVLNNKTCIIDGTVYIGSTLWTDMDRGNPLVMLKAKLEMNDYRYIRYGTINDPYRSKLTPEDTVLLFHKNVDFITKELDKYVDTEYNICIITHHAPSFESVPDRYKEDKLSHAYYSSLESLIMTYNPDIWCHGHIHDAKDYIIGTTRILCNPYGYQGENTGFIDLKFKL